MKGTDGELELGDVIIEVPSSVWRPDMDSIGGMRRIKLTYKGGGLILVSCRSPVGVVYQRRESIARLTREKKKSGGIVGGRS